MAGPKILVFAEQRQGVVSRVYRELMGVAHSLAHAKGGEAAALWIGRNSSAVMDELKSAEPAKLFLAEHPALEHFLDDVYSGILHRIVQEYQPDVVLGGATAIGRSLLARVAALCDTGLVADCVAFDWDGDLLRMTRPVYGSASMSIITIPQKRPQMATVRPKAFAQKVPNPAATCEIIEVGLSEVETKSRVQVLQQVQEGTDRVDLAAADVIVSGGRGMRGPEHFQLIRELAETLGGAVGASRSAVDAGWISYSHQVGQTGKTVRPKLYIACGISGTVQHLVGMRTSDTIVAVNKDPDAPIFDVADIGLVGDLFEVVPLLTKRLKELRKN